MKHLFELLRKPLNAKQLTFVTMVYILIFAVIIQGTLNVLFLDALLLSIILTLIFGLFMAFIYHIIKTNF